MSGSDFKVMLASQDELKVFFLYTEFKKLCKINDTIW